jgi:hypothetical protein
MKRCRARVVGFAMLVFIMVNFTSVHAEEKAVAEGNDTAVGSILELLIEKKIITGEEAAAFVRQMVYKTLAREDMKALVDLLREKGVVTGDEAASFIQKLARTPSPEEEKRPVAQAPVAKIEEAEKLVLPAGDKEFIRQLRELWVKKGNRGVDFDAQFGDIKDVETIIDRMRVIGIITPDYAAKLDKFYREKFLSGAVTTVLENKEQDYIDQIRKNTAWEIDEKIHDKLKDEWWQKIHLSGDILLRYEGDFFDKNNGTFIQPSNPTQLMNSTIEQDRMRARFRLDVNDKLADGLEMGAGIATGTTGNPTLTVTLGDSFNNQSIVLYKAFLKWNPTPYLTFWGGRFVNPWFYTDLVWYPVLNFDGIAVQYSQHLAPDWSLFFTAGAFPLEYVQVSARDKWLFGGQTGFEYNHLDNLRAKVGVAFYDYVHTVGIVNNPNEPGLTNWTAPQFQQKGNTLMDIDPSSNILTAYAAKFRELNVTGSLDLGYWHPTHVTLIGDYVNNLGFNQSEVNANTGTIVPKQTIGYQLGFTVGNPTMQKFADWKALLFYKYLQSDAVMDAYTDQDFHLGGTNAKGWIIGADFGLAKNVWLRAKWFTANEITGPPLAIDVFQLDVNARF